MAKTIKHWKEEVDNLGTLIALTALKNQSFNIPRENRLTGPFAIKSKASGKIYTSYSPDLRLSSSEVLGNWILMCPDNDEEEKNNKIIQLAKESNCTGLSYERLDNMDTESIWNHLVTFMFTPKIKYRIMKWVFENKVYKDK